MLLSINRILISLNKQSLPCYFKAKNILDKKISLIFKEQRPYLFHLSSFNPNKDSKDFGKDPEMKKLIKEMYEDFDIEKTEADSVDQSDDASSNNYKEFSKNIDNFNENLSSEIKFSSDIIYDFDEEKQLREQGLWPKRERRPAAPPKEEIVYKRGKTGVFDVEELVDFLRDQKAFDIVVIHVPPEIQYVDYMVIGTGKSLKHISVLAEHIKKLHKRKKNKQDRFILVEGEKSNWVAIDMDNIALHLMKEDIREEKDLETLWTVGAEFDDKSRQESENPFSIEEIKKEQENT